MKVRYPVISERLLNFTEFPIGFQLRKYSMRAALCESNVVIVHVPEINATLSGIVFNLLGWI